MSRYRVVFAGSSKKELDKLDSVTRRRIAIKLRYFLGQDDPLIFAKPLIHGRLGNYRFRVGHYRIVFDVAGDIIQIVSVKHRRDVYRP